MSQLSHRSGNTSPRSRKWIFVIHNWTTEHVTKIIDFCTINGHEYLFAEEMGEEKNTPHLQGYIQSKNAIRFDTLKNLEKTIHLEKAKGNLQQQFDYITKKTENTIQTSKNPMKKTSKKSSLKMSSKNGSLNTTKFYNLFQKNE